MPESLFTCRPAILVKKKSWHWCFPREFWKIFKKTFLQNTSRRLLLNRAAFLYDFFFIIAFLIDLKIPHIRGFVACSKRALKFPVRTGCRTLTVNNHLNKHFFEMRNLEPCQQKSYTCDSFFSLYCTVKHWKLLWSQCFDFTLIAKLIKRGMDCFEFESYVILEGIFVLVCPKRDTFVCLARPFSKEIGSWTVSNSPKCS